MQYVESIYDNGGISADRYSIKFTPEFREITELNGLAVSSDCNAPNGVFFMIGNDDCSALPLPHDTRIDELPEIPAKVVGDWCDNAFYDFIDGEARRLVNQEVYANVGAMVEYILQKSLEDSDAPYSYEDIPFLPDPVGEDWDGDQLAESLRDHGYEWGDVLQNWAFLDPDDYRSDPVEEKWNANQCFVAMDEGMEDWDEVCRDVLEPDVEKSIPTVNNIEENDLILIRVWCERNLDLPVAWPEPEDIDEVDLVDLRQGLADSGDLEEREVFEWWLISGYLAGKLESAGEIVVDGELWGRQTTGQAICMDGVIQEIAKGIHSL